MSGFNIVRMTVFLPSYVLVREQLPNQFTSNNVNRCKENRALIGKNTSTSADNAAWSRRLIVIFISFYVVTD